ncbi:MAG: efflux RND transporter periplasmic adaptor subunit [Thalassotalea sp.]
MKPTRLPYLIIIIGLIGLLLYLNFYQAAKKPAKKSASPTKVVVQTVQKQEFKDLIEALGTTKANEEVTLYSQYSARVKDLHFEGGDTVKVGQLLVSLNGDEEEAEVKELQVNLAEAKRKLTRLKNLQKTKSASLSEVDEQTGQVDAIKAQLEQALAKLAKYKISAPFNGILGNRNISVGTYLSSQTPITTIDDISIIKVDFTLPEKDLTKIKLGQKIEATNIAYGNKVFIGQVMNIDTRLNPVTRSISVRAHINNDNSKLKPGMLLTIHLLRSIDETILIDERALIPKEDKQWVYVVDNNVVKAIAVTIGRRRSGIVEILAGLEINQQVIIEGALKVRDGAVVIAISREE